MSLIEKATAIKKLSDDKELKDKNNELLERSNLESELKKFKKILFSEIDLLDGKQTKHGIFKLKKESDICYITCDGKRVAWFKYKILFNVLCQMSDDCSIRMSFVEINSRFYQPHRNQDDDGTWDTQELRYYHNGGFSESVSEIEKMPKFLEKIAGHLSYWM